MRWCRGCAIGPFLGLSLFLAAGCERTPGPSPSPIVAMIGDDSISLKEFRSALLEAQISGPMDEDSEPVKELKRSILDQLIEQRLFLAEARRENLGVTPEELRQATDRIMTDYAQGEFEALLKSRQMTREDWQDRLRRELLTQKVIRNHVPDSVEIQPDEIQSYYGDHPREFVLPEVVRARQIVVAGEDKARELLARILDGEDFAALASAHSLSPDKDQGGDLGFFGKGQMPEEFDIVFGLAPGKISPIVKTSYGYHIFSIEEKRPAKTMTPEEAAERIRSVLIQERRELLFKAWVASLKKKSRITVNNQILYQPVEATDLGPEGPNE